MNMKNEFEKTEELLKSGQQLKLSESEKKDMFTTLEAYADFYSPTPAQYKPPQTSWFSFSTAKVMLASLALVVIFGTSTTINANQSLPGHFLYPVKTDVLEPMVGLFSFSEIDELEYQVELSERRFFEMEELVKIKKLTPKTMQIITSQTDEHVREVADLVLQLDSSEESLAAISDLVSIINAQEFTKNKNLQPETDSGADLTIEKVQELYSSELREVAVNLQEVTDYIETTLDKIDATVAEETPETADIKAELSEYFEDISQALQDNDYEAAAEFSSEAEQLIEFTEYTEE